MKYCRVITFKYTKEAPDDIYNYGRWKSGRDINRNTFKYNLCNVAAIPVEMNNLKKLSDKIEIVENVKYDVSNLHGHIRIYSLHILWSRDVENSHINR